VHRIQNGALHLRFEEARRKTPTVTEQVAYHGTRLNVPAGIYDSPTGFNMICGTARPGSVATPLTCVPTMARRERWRTSRCVFMRGC
jgi:hypothetical protein